MCEFEVSELRFELIVPIDLSKCTMGHKTMTTTLESHFSFLKKRKEKKRSAQSTPTKYLTAHKYFRAKTSLTSHYSFFFFGRDRPHHFIKRSNTIFFVKLLEHRNKLMVKLLGHFLIRLLNERKVV